MNENARRKLSSSSLDVTQMRQELVTMNLIQRKVLKMKKERVKECLKNVVRQYQTLCIYTLRILKSEGKEDTVEE